MIEGATPRLFVSHHSSKYDIAQQVEALLAERGIRCWIAPRDVPPGAPFDSAIQQAINECAAVLLLFCSNSDKSRHVKRELILGDSAGRPIIPLRLEAIDPGELAYHLADSQWIDWIDRREAVMDRVAAQVRLYAGAPAELAGDVATLGNELTDSPAPQKDGERKWLIPALVGALLLAVGLAGYFAMRGPDDPSGEADVMAQTGEGTATDGDEAAQGADTDAGPDTGAGTGAGTGAEDAGEPDTPAPTPAPTSRPTARPSGLVLEATPVPQPTPTVRPTRAPSQVITAPATQAALRRVVQACAGAPSDAEYLICANRDLDTRARQMSGMIREVRAAYAAAGENDREFNRGQSDWMNGVRASCSSAACVENAQRNRIRQLQQILDRFAAR